MKYLLIICLLFGCSTIDKKQSISNYKRIDKKIVYLKQFKIKHEMWISYYTGYIKGDKGAIWFKIPMHLTYLHTGQPRFLGLVYRETYYEHDINGYEEYHLYLPEKIVEGLK